MSLLAYGSMAFDTVISPQGTLDKVIGGSVSYFALSASYFNPISIISLIGDDFSAEFLKFLASRKISLSGLERKAGRTFEWVGEYENLYSKAKTVKEDYGILADYQPRITAEHKSADYVFLASSHPQKQNIVLSQIDKPYYVLVSTSLQWIKNEKTALMDLIQKVDSLLLTSQEAMLLSGESSVISAVTSLLGLGLMHVLIYDRDFGATLYSQNIVLMAPAYPTFNPKDPTGMSYGFAGAFLGYLAWVNELKSKSYKKALKYGVLLASFIQEEFSINRLRTLTNADIENRLNIYLDMI